MERKEVEIYSEASNYAIVRMPGRNFPGCVIQGDSLSILLRNAQAILQRARVLGNTQVIELAEDLVESLSGRLDHYEGVLKEHGVGLPYVRGGNTEPGAAH